eukprot:g3521.t1
MLRERGAAVSGRKNVLIERLEKIIEKERERKRSSGCQTEECTGSRNNATRSIVVNTVLWYFTSIVCTTTSKQIKFVPKLFLSTNQFLVATVCAFCACNTILGGIRPLERKSSFGLWVLAASFAVGMLSLNMSFEFMDVSLAMTLRATEPIFTVMLTWMFLTSNLMPPTRALLSLIPIVVGAGLSSFNAVDFSVIGATLLAISNVAFATRAVVYKDVKADSGLSAYELFFYICRNGSVIYLLLCIVSFVAREDMRQAGNALLTTLDLPRVSLLLVNGICYFLYLQLSVVVLSQVSAITHGVMNAMRRPATIAASTAWFGVSLGPLSIGGIALACLGSLSYSVAQKAAHGRQR